jgi:1-acyl-sn-glycerol-3-phosphate acyltransferase
MFKIISKILFKAFGWKLTDPIPDGITRCVMVIAPHTSLWDFVIGRLAFNLLGIRVRFMIKKEFFWFPLGPLLKLMGGIPVNRKKPTAAVLDVVNLFKKKEELVVAITPEGTRSLVNVWKKGYYKIAQTANVPMVLGYIDYSKKVCGIGPAIYPSGNYQADLRNIEEFYRGVQARHPEKFNLSK